METLLMTLTRNLFRSSYFATIATALILSISMFSPNALSEEQEGSTLGRIYLAQINSYYSINGFYNFSANQGDQKHLTVIVDSSNKIDELINTIQGEVNDSPDTDDFKEVSGAWKKYKKVLNQNIKEVKKTGYPDLRLAGDMATENIKLNSTLETLYNSLAGTPSNKPNKITEMSRKAGISLALMMTKYSARTTSTVSQVYSGGDTEITIDTLAAEFETILKELMNQTKGNEQALDLLDSALTKWDFIKSSYINYNENRVNFIVNLYSKKIISDIDLALESL